MTDQAMKVQCFVVGCYLGICLFGFFRGQTTAEKPNNAVPSTSRPGITNTIYMARYPRENHKAINGADHWNGNDDQSAELATLLRIS
jgi:hypothetical protein